MSDYAAIYRNFFETIGYSLQPEHSAPFPASVIAPKSVTQFYEIAGNAEEWTQSFNRFLAPNQWKNGDFCVLVEENQAVMLWGFRRDEAHLPDPPIYQAVNDENATLEWEPFGLGCNEFILFTLAFQPFNAEEVFPVLDKTTFKKKLGKQIERSRDWTKVVSWEEARVYVRPGVLLCHDNWVEGPTLFCGTHSKNELKQIGAELGVKWDGGLC